MALKKEKEQAIKFRKEGMSYSQIKKRLHVSKSTLSIWLKDMPLSKARLNELQRNEVVIEKIRIAKQKKREQRLQEVFEKVSGDIGKLSKREFFIAGFFLYWAEGGKTERYSISLSNTDPNMIRAYIQWLELLRVSKDKIRIRLHLYTDMDELSEVNYWSKIIAIPKKNFTKSYVKKSKLSDLTYITRGHGTCNVIVTGRDVSEYVMQGLKKISSEY